MGRTATAWSYCRLVWLRGRARTAHGLGWEQWGQLSITWTARTATATCGSTATTLGSYRWGVAGNLWLVMCWGMGLTGKTLGSKGGENGCVGACVYGYVLKNRKLKVRSFYESWVGTWLVDGLTRTFFEDYRRDGMSVMVDVWDCWWWTAWGLDLKASGWELLCWRLCGQMHGLTRVVELVGRKLAKRGARAD